MNKEEFITQLKQSIQILDDQEQQYFVEEYTQHIDMKMSQGMTEEEAVKEMGSVEELSKEILESYHVKISAAENQAKKSVSFETFFSKIKVQADKIYAHLAAACKKTGEAITKLFRRRRNALEGLPDKEKTEKTEKKSCHFGTIGRLLRAFVHFCGRVFRSCVYIALWCLMLLWNCLAIFFGLMALFFMAICIFVLGICLVMLAQGYPVIGFTVASIGASMVMGSLVIACFILTRWKVHHHHNKLEGGEQHA